MHNLISRQCYNDRRLLHCNNIYLASEWGGGERNSCNNGTSGHNANQYWERVIAARAAVATLDRRLATRFNELKNK